MELTKNLLEKWTIGLFYYENYIWTKKDRYPYSTCYSREYCDGWHHAWTPYSKWLVCKVAKENGIVAGLPVVEYFSSKLDKSISLRRKVKEGAFVRKGNIIAVVAGGGFNHIMELYDQVLVKDNHLDI